MGSPSAVVENQAQQQQQQQQQQEKAQHTFGQAICAYCTREFTKISPTQIFCKDPACKLASRPDLVRRRANYPMIRCRLEGCKAEPFQQLRPDHQFCSTIHRVQWHNNKNYAMRELELNALREENRQLREQLAALTSATQQKKRKKA